MLKVLMVAGHGAHFILDFMFFLKKKGGEGWIRAMGTVDSLLSFGCFLGLRYNPDMRGLLVFLFNDLYILICNTNILI